MKLKVDDICEGIQALYEIVGEDGFLEITKSYGGTTIYIPTYKSAIRSKRNKDIVKRFNGVNINILAREYNLSVTQIKKIIKDYDIG